jgi:hypothetical protein
MLIRMASQWRTFQRFAEHLVFNEAPKFIRQLQHPGEMQQAVQRTIQSGIQHGLRLGIEALVATAMPPPPVAIKAGRPVTRDSVPTAHRARRVVYAPDLDGRADPGEIVWTWVVYEDDPTKGKDRPVLVVGRDRSTLLGLMLSSQAHHTHDPDWVHIGVGSWDHEGRPSWVRLDRVLDVPEESIRREGAIVDRITFEVVATRLRSEYSWR